MDGAAGRCDAWTSVEARAGGLAAGGLTATGCFGAHEAEIAIATKINPWPQLNFHEGLLSDLM